MRRIVVILTVAALLVVALTVTAGTGFAKQKPRAGTRTSTGFSYAFCPSEFPRIVFVGNPVSEKNSSRQLAEPGREGGGVVTKPQLHDHSARASSSYGLYQPSLTSTISSATLPCASRWMASAASLFGASARQKTSPLSSLYQYRWYLTPYSFWISRSFLWASATASAVNPSTLLWWSMNSAIVPILLSLGPYVEGRVIGACCAGKPKTAPQRKFRPAVGRRSLTALR